jgi:L-fuconolactonase
MSEGRAVRIDSHHHFWEIGRYNYPWLTPELNVLQRNFRPADLQPLLAQSEIKSSVLVQTISSVEETRWFLQLAEKYSFIAGVVGWVDLTSPHVSDVLDELKAPRLIGIRHQVHDEADDNWLIRQDVQKGFRELSKRSLTFDLLIRPQHLQPALKTVQMFPELSFVVDHIAKPRIASSGWDDWAEGIASLARCPNVWCKLSGMITEANWTQWRKSDLRPYINHVFQVFGVNRVMFGSDWPVCLLAGSYQQVVEALEENLDQLTAQDKMKVFGLNAAKFYRLDSLRGMN